MVWGGMLPEKYEMTKRVKKEKTDWII